MTVATKKLLLDVREAGESILEHTSGKTFREYSADRFEIIGEALRRIEQRDPRAAAQIPELRLIVDFRNRIIHGYDTVDDAVVWGVIETHLPSLTKEVKDLLEST
jgi:uncharacterized protein with HEPN domain